MRVIVNLVGDPDHGRLAESRFVERKFIYGGERSMYTLAFAAAAQGHEVELRGWLKREVFDVLAAAVGVAPAVDLPARRPEAGELVVVPEGWRDPLDYLRMLLSPARLAIFLLAPPGLFGWPMTEPGWTVPDPLTVPLDAVARPEHFQALGGLGIALLTLSPGIARAAEAAGVSCSLVGTGAPAPPPVPAADADRPVDAIGLKENRWAPLVEQAASELEDLNLDLIEESPREEVLARMARARLMLWPSRIEGHATILWEARMMGCVPVALSTNRFAVGLSEECGAVVVDRVEDIAPAARELLADEARWRELSARAMRTAPDEVRWDRYLERVKAFIESLDAQPTAARVAAGALGDALEQALEDRAAKAQSSIEELAAELERVRADRDRLHYELHQRQNP